MLMWKQWTCEDNMVENAGNGEKWVLASVLPLVIHGSAGKSSVALIIIFFNEWNK